MHTKVSRRGLILAACILAFLLALATGAWYLLRWRTGGPNPVLYQKGASILMLAEPGSEAAILAGDLPEKAAGNRTISAVSYAGAGKFAVYRKYSRNGAGILCIHDFSEEKVIDTDVADFYLSADNQNVYYLAGTGDGRFRLAIYPIGRDSGKLTLDTGLSSFLISDAGDLYYKKSGDLYLMKKDRDKAKILSDVGQYLLTRSGRLYFTRAGSVAFQYGQFIKDAQADQDMAMAAPDLTAIDQIEKLDEFGKYRIIDADQYNQLVARYNDKLQRDYQRNVLARADFKVRTWDLYQWTGSEASLVDQDVTRLVLNADGDVLQYRKHKTEPAADLTIQEAMQAGAAGGLAAATGNQAVSRLLIPGQVPFELEASQYVYDTWMSPDGRYLFVDWISEDEKTDNISRYEIDGGILQKGILVAADVAGYAGYQGRIYYLAHEKSNTGQDGDEWSSLYGWQDGTATLISGRAYSFSLNKQGILAYIEDYNSENASGTLYLYTGGSARKITDNVNQYLILDSRQVYCLKAYESQNQAGELYAIIGTAKPRLIDKDVSDLLFSQSLIPVRPSQTGLPDPPQDASMTDSDRVIIDDTFQAAVQKTGGPAYVQPVDGSAADPSVMEIPAVFTVSGNTGGNLANRGFCAQQGDWIYYGCTGLNKMKSDGSEWTALGVDSYPFISFINVVDDWIYFSYRHDPSTEIMARIRTDGSGYQELYRNGSIDGLVVVDGLIYFGAGAHNDADAEEGVFRMNLDGNGKILLATTFISSRLQIYQNRIYFGANMDVVSGFGIYNMNLDGSDLQKINISGVVGTHYFGGINDGKISYRHGADLVYAVCDLDGGNPAAPIDGTGFGGALFTGQTIYFIEGNAIYRYRAGDTGPALIYRHAAAKRISQINLTRDWIFFRISIEDSESDFSGYYEAYRVRKDGTGMVALP